MGIHWEFSWFCLGILTGFIGNSQWGSTWEASYHENSHGAKMMNSPSRKSPKNPWLVVWNINSIFPLILGWCHHPNWRNHIFQRGEPTTNQKILCEWKSAMSFQWWSDDSGRFRRLWIFTGNDQLDSHGLWKHVEVGIPADQNRRKVLNAAKLVFKDKGWAAIACCWLVYITKFSIGLWCYRYILTQQDGVMNPTNTNRDSLGSDHVKIHRCA